MLAGVLCSCAGTKDHVKIDYIPSDYSITSASNATIHIERLRDSRGVDPQLILFKGRRDGQYLNKTIFELLTNSIKNLLIKMGFHLDSSEYEVTLTGEVLKFDLDRWMGFGSGAIEASIQLNLKLINNQNESIIWSEIISGQGKKDGIHFDDWEYRKEAIDLAMDNLMRNISSSETLKAAINRI